MAGNSQPEVIVMSISNRVVDYLDQQHIYYDTVNHPMSNSALGSAIASSIIPSRIAKAIVLQDHESRNLMAVVPADRKISLTKLESLTDSSLHLLKENELMDIFDDCQQGAIPALGDAYHMNTIYDEALNQFDDIYLEAGDHKTLIHLSSEQFSTIMANAKHARFSSEVVH